MVHILPVSRRAFVFGGCAISLAASTGTSWAQGGRAGGRKLVVVILRGAMDGLAALPKIDDPNISQHRAALVDPSAVKLDDGFALHSAMPGLAALYRDKQAAFIPAAAGPYRERSHFEAQDLLECGGVARVSADGWLNRALQKAPRMCSAVSIGPATPLILRGAATQVTSWSPPVLPAASDDTLARLMALYEGDAQLHAALAAAVGADRVASDMAGKGGARGGPAQYAPLMAAAGRFLAAPDAPDIAVVSLEGWDTHAGQNAALKQRFEALDAGMTALREAMGETWASTAVVAVSEFGRTVRVNGAGGTDHGTGGLAILAGGAVKGGRILGDWPGLAPAALFEDRDLKPTTDVRAVFKGLLRDHLGWDARDLHATVFADSAAATPLSGLV
jgi:uncharacterized protein (DUF1501 family)